MLTCSVPLTLGKARQSVAVQLNVLVACRERRTHEFAAFAAHQVDYLLERHAARPVLPKPAHNPLGSKSPVSEISGLEGAYRRMNNEVREPRAIGSATRRASAVGKRAIGQKEAGELFVADATLALEHIEEHAAGREVGLSKHHHSPSVSS